jgi:hypothetical protein
MSAVNVANNPIGSYPVKVTREGAGAGVVNVQHVNVDNIAGLSLPEYDYFAVTYPLATQEVYTFKTGGSGGTTVATVTLNYTDATKEFLLNGAKT